ncbi:Rz1-like lysis system protein LysC [Klebsiella pneumoniae]
MTQCRLEKSAARTNGDLLTALDEAEAAWRSALIKWTR